MGLEDAWKVVSDAENFAYAVQIRRDAEARIALGGEREAVAADLLKEMPEFDPTAPEAEQIDVVRQQAAYQAVFQELMGISLACQGYGGICTCGVDLT